MKFLLVSFSCFFYIQMNGNDFNNYGQLKWLRLGNYVITVTGTPEWTSQTWVIPQPQKKSQNLSYQWTDCHFANTTLTPDLIQTKENNNSNVSPIKVFHLNTLDSTETHQLFITVPLPSSWEAPQQLSITYKLFRYFTVLQSTHNTTRWNPD